MERIRALRREHSRAAWSAGLLLAALSASASAALGTAVEFYHAGFDHYFLTASPGEAAALDAGAFNNSWSRTGGQFTVYSDPAPELSPVCRFFGILGNGISTHFYTANADECALVKTYLAWTYEGIAFYIRTPAGGACGADAPVYRSFYSDQVVDMNHRFTADLTAHVRMPQRRGDVPEGIAMCAPVTDAEREADVVRFLEHATLGPTEALVQAVKAKGIPAWLDEQLAMNVTRYTQYPFFPTVSVQECPDDPTPPATPEKFCFTLKLAPSPVAWEFFRQSKTAPDQLRLRMAHVWHQIFVVGEAGTVTYGTAEFQQRLRDNAFGTFENLLVRYALAPQLGNFQNWVKNRPEHDGIRPNENFARELMQLFTIGVSELNDDGTFVLDAQGRQIPTYGQSDIETLARILTGYSYPPRPGTSSSFFGNLDYYVGDMVPFGDPFHDKNPKSALGGRIAFPGGGDAATEVAALIRALVNHPNTPPFIARQLIQKTVTSSPTPGYVARVAAVFKDNGQGVRGDLGAVTKAVLLDPEARGARKIDPEYGRMREPALMWTAMIRGLDVTTDGWMPWALGRSSAQELFQSPTVFSYYPSDYTLAGGGNIPAPEFAIYGSGEFLNRANQVNDLLFNIDKPGLQSPVYGWGPRGYVPNATGTPSPTLAAFLPDAANTDALVERLNRLFLHGTMSAAARKTIVNSLNKLDATDSLRRIKLALTLILVSIDYQVQK